MRVGKFDVAVVGAGPAGSTAALTLSSGGARVALVDKSSFPVTKPAATWSGRGPSLCSTNSGSIFEVLYR